MSDRLNEMFFSQNSLDIFSKCRLKFKKRYVDGLWWRSKETQGENHIEKGRLFHLLAYRYFMGMDNTIEDETGELEEINVWLEKLKKFISREENVSKKYFPEYELRLSAKEIKLQAKYDLIVIDDKNRAVIYDWKVQDKPIKVKQAESSFQTRVYRYMMAKVGDVITGKAIKPQDITMIYWQAKHPAAPVVIEYSEELYKQDEEFFKAEIEKILKCDFNSAGLKAEDERICRFCEFCSICNGFDAEEVNDDSEGFDLEWEEVEEIEF